jgi:hypothetical protein
MVRLWKFSSCLTHMSAYVVTAQCSTTARKLLKTPAIIPAIENTYSGLLFIRIAKMRNAA